MPDIEITIEFHDGPYWEHHWSYMQYRIAVVKRMFGGQTGERHYRDSLAEAEEVKKDLEVKYAIQGREI